MRTTVIKNKSYMFIPFILERGEPPDAFRQLAGAVEESADWTRRNDEVRYIYKYVADKFNGQDPWCQCFHYRLEEGSRGKYGLPDPDYCCRFTTTPKFQSRYTDFGFYILEVHLYLFSTSVGILAFKLRFEKEDPFWIASAQYNLKKASRQSFSTGRKETGETTALELSRALMSAFGREKDFNFFYYANEKNTERAHFLTFLPVGMKRDYRQELYYLRRCYNDGFQYIEEESDNDVIHFQSKDIQWGISTEAAICLACPELGRPDFIEGTLYPNFDTQYLFMYIMLLHQKYALYRFLTKIGVGAYNKLEQLEKFREQLYEFEADFVFDCVTEVPQYQNLYDKITAAFALKRMYQDVREPLVKLSEMRREDLENEQKQRDKNVNRALIVISVLSVFSALVDSFQFAEGFMGWFHANTAFVRLVQGGCIALIFAVFIWALYSLLSSLRSSKRRRKNVRYQKKKRQYQEKKRSYHYVGFFFDFDELTEKVRDIRRDPLSRSIREPHVTYEFQPHAVDAAMFGTEAEFEITGYGNDGRNEGLVVRLVSKKRRLREMIGRIDVPHITLAICEDGQSVNTRDLAFEPVSPIRIKGKFGGYTEGDGVVYEEVQE